jgi:hypothetical protein
MLPPPLEVAFLRIFNTSEQAPQFGVQVKNVTASTIVEFRIEICPTGTGGQEIIDPNTGRPCFVVSEESVLQPDNARPSTGYVEVNSGLYEKTENGETLQWANTRYPSWVGTGFESARGANVALTYTRFESGEIWEDGRLNPPGTQEQP